MPKTIKEAVQAQQKILRSEFLGFLYPVKDTEEARSVISEHQKLYANATHNCFAYIIGDRQQTQYYSDAGEPSGTAGKPMLSALLRAELTNVLAIVTRYYGGVKLGAKGLIEAYEGSVAQAISIAELISYVELTELLIKCDYAGYDLIRGKSAEWQAEIKETSFSERVEMVVSLPRELLTEFRVFLDGLKIYRQLDYELRNGALG